MNARAKSLFLCALFLLPLAPTTKATETTYDVAFTAGSGLGPLYGSGTLTFDDTPAPAGSNHYLFTSVVGGGGFLGAWATSTFDYDPTTGLSEWILSLVGGASINFPGAVTTGISPTSALEETFASRAGQGELTWARHETTTVPDGGATIGLLGLGIVGLAAVRRSSPRGNS